MWPDWSTTVWEGEVIATVVSIVGWCYSLAIWQRGRRVDRELSRRGLHQSRQALVADDMRFQGKVGLGGFLLMLGLGCWSMTRPQAPSGSAYIATLALILFEIMFMLIQAHNQWTWDQMDRVPPLGQSGDQGTDEMIAQRITGGND